MNYCGYATEQTLKYLATIGTVSVFQYRIIKIYRNS